MSELSLAPPDKTSLQRDAQTWADRVRALAITNAEGCTQASFLLRSIKGVRSDIQRFFQPHIEAAQETKRKADQARKALVDEQDRMEAPLVAAEASVKRALLAYEQQQEDLRRAEEARLQREAQARAEALVLEAAAAMERDGHASGDDALVQEAADLIAQPVEAPAVSVKSSVPKVQGVVYRDNWKAHPEIDVKKLAAAIVAGVAPASFLTPNMTAINQWARATQGTQDCPGVRVFNDRQIAARG